MKKKTKWILGGVALLVVFVSLAGLIYVRFFFEFNFGEGPAKRVNLAGWAKLEKGMTRKQVIHLLGDSHNKAGASTFTIGDDEFETSERWEYNWTVGIPLFGEVHPKAYVVYFDVDGKLATWREPIEEGNDPKQSE